MKRFPCGRLTLIEMLPHSDARRQIRPAVSPIAVRRRSRRFCLHLGPPSSRTGALARGLLPLLCSQAYEGKVRRVGVHGQTVNVLLISSVLESRLKVSTER